MENFYHSFSQIRHFDLLCVVHTPMASLLCGRGIERSGRYRDMVAIAPVYALIRTTRHLRTVIHKTRPGFSSVPFMFHENSLYDLSHLPLDWLLNLYFRFTKEVSMFQDHVSRSMRYVGRS